MQRHGGGIIDEEHRVRVADVDRHRVLQRAGCEPEVEGVAFLGQRNIPPIEAGRAHVDGDAAVLGADGGQHPGLGLDPGLGGFLFGHHQLGDAAGAVAARPGLGPVGVEDAHEHVGGPVPLAIFRRLDDQELVATDAQTPIGDGARVGTAEADVPLAGVEDDEIVAQAVHFDERQFAHGGVICPPGPAVNRFRLAGAGPRSWSYPPWAFRNRRMWKCA